MQRPKKSPAPENVSEIPYPPIKENVEKIKDWILERYAASAFNRCTYQELNVMAGEPMKINFKKDAVPHAVQTPIRVPINLEKRTKEGIDKDVRLGIIEEVPRHGFKKGSVERQSCPWLKAQGHDSCPLNFRDTTQGHDSGTRSCPLSCPYRVPYSCPLGTRIVSEISGTFRDTISGTRIVSLIVSLSCPLIVSLRDTNRVQNFRDTNQGHESGTRHESCPWTCPWVVTIVPESSGTRSRDTI